MKDNPNNNGPDIEKFLNYLDKETADKIRNQSTGKKKETPSSQKVKIKRKRCKEK